MYERNCRGGGALAEQGGGGDERSPQRTQATEGMGRVAQASLGVYF